MPYLMLLNLNDEDVAVLDEMIAVGCATDRRSALSGALGIARNRISAEADALIYRDTPPDDDLDALQAWLSRR